MRDLCNNAYCSDSACKISYFMAKKVPKNGKNSTCTSVHLCCYRGEKQPKMTIKPKFLRGELDKN